MPGWMPNQDPNWDKPDYDEKAAYNNGGAPPLYRAAAAAKK